MAQAAAIFAAVQIVGSVAGGILQKKAIEAEADAAESAALFNAAQTEREALAESSRRRRLARRELSSQRVAFAKAGVRLEGTPLELLAQNAAEFELDAVNVEIAGRQSARLDRLRAANIQIVAKTRAGAALLSGFTGAAGSALSLVGTGGSRTTTTTSTTRSVSSPTTRGVGRGFGGIGG